VGYSQAIILKTHYCIQMPHVALVNRSEVSQYNCSGLQSYFPLLSPASQYSMPDWSWHPLYRPGLERLMQRRTVTWLAQSALSAMRLTDVKDSPGLAHVMECTGLSARRSTMRWHVLPSTLFPTLGLNNKMENYEWHAHWTLHCSNKNTWPITFMDKLIWF
jgi:hypothetical protein